MAKKERENRSSRIPRFYVIYLTVTVVVILLVFILLQVVKSRLAEYELVQPKYVAEEVFARYFEPVNYAKLLADARYEAGEVELDELVDYLKEEIGEAELSYAVGLSNEENEIRYVVKAGSKQLAAIVLNVADEKTEHGYQTYEFSYIELYLNMEAYLEELAKTVVTIEVPGTYSVMVDGELLSAELITETYTLTDLTKYYPSDVPDMEYAVYTVKTLGELPGEVIVTNPEGIEAEVRLNEDTLTYTCGLVYNESMKADYGEFVTKALEGYAAYVQASEDVSLSSIKGYFDTSSDAYADVVTAGGNRWMVNEWSGIDFEDVTVEEFYVHTPEIFSCRISFTQLLHRDGKEDFKDAIDMYVFLHLTEGGYKIYHWFNAP